MDWKTFHRVDLLSVKLTTRTNPLSAGADRVLDILGNVVKADLVPEQVGTGRMKKHSADALREALAGPHKRSPFSIHFARKSGPVMDLEMSFYQPPRRVGF